MILSSFQPIASAIIDTDSASPTWRTLASSTFFWNCSRVRPAPIFCWNGSRRTRASWMRSTRMLSTRSHTPVSVIGSASIVKPGLTPVPSTATFAFFAIAWMARAYFMLAPVGYASSSVVDTIGTFSLRISSICGSTFLSDESVQSTTTSGLVALIVFFASSDTLTRSARPTPATSPEIAPDLRGVDVHRADDLETAAIGDLFDDRRADRAEPVVEDLDRSLACCHL